MERLTIKELAPYLPYGVLGIEKRGAIYELGVEPTFGTKPHKRDCYSFITYSIKPLLRPLSSLTEGRTDSQYSTPIEQIVKESEQHCDAYDEWLEIFIDDPDPSRILQAPYEVVQELIEQKFDIFCLIDRGLALPIDGKEVEGE